MNDVDQTATLPPSPLPPAPTAPVEASYAGPPQPRFVDRVLGMRAVIAVALASLVIGGAGGALLGATTNGGDGGRGPGGFQGGIPQGGFPQQGRQGQLPNQGQAPNQGQQQIPGR